MDDRFRWSVFEANTFETYGLDVTHGTERIMVRSNVFLSDNDRQINVDGYNWQYRRGIVDLTIANNTGINDGEHGSFLYLWGKADGIKLVNNLYVADELIVGSPLHRQRLRQRTRPRQL